MEQLLKENWDRTAAALAETMDKAFFEEDFFKEEPLTLSKRMRKGWLNARVLICKRFCSLLGVQMSDLCDCYDY